MPVIDLSYARADALNLTGITDAVTPGNSMAFGYSAANRLNAAAGPWGTLTWQYDGVGNRTQEVATPPGGSAATDTYAYPGTSNRTATVTRGAQKSCLALPIHALPRLDGRGRAIGACALVRRSLSRRRPGTMRGT